MKSYRIEETNGRGMAHLRGRSLTATEMRPFRPVPLACDEEPVLLCDVPGDKQQLLVLDPAMDPGILV